MKTLLRLKFFCFISIVALVLSCSKSDNIIVLEDVVNENNIVIIASNYYNSLKQGSRLDGTDLSILFANISPNWNSAKVYKDKNDLVLVSALSYDITDEKLGFLRRVVFRYDRTGILQFSGIVEIEGANNFLLTNQSLLFTIFLESNIQGYKGKVRIFDIFFLLQEEKQYQNGKNTSLKKLTKKPKVQNYNQSKARLATDCIDWYWVTYDTATGEVTDEQYVETTCPSGGGDGSGSTTTSSGLYGPYLCPTPFNVINVGTNERLLKTQGVTIGFNSTFAIMNITVNVNNRVPTSNFLHPVG